MSACYTGLHNMIFVYIIMGYFDAENNMRVSLSPLSEPIEASKQTG